MTAAAEAMQQLEPMFRRMQLSTMAAAALQGLLASSQDDLPRDFVQLSRMAWNIAEVMQLEGRRRELAP